MLIDSHTHVWPDKIAGAALSANELPELRARGDGTVGGLMADMEASGVALSCCLAVANLPRQVDRVNEWVSSLASAERFPFGTVHVELSAEENLASLRRYGIRAVKVHPLFQDYALDDRRLWELFEAFGSEIAVITHVGAGGSPAANRLATPGMIRDIARQFPDLRLIACHFGGYKLFDDAREMLSGVDVVLETSWPPTLALLQPDRVRRLINDHGADRVVFGSDWPMTSPVEELAALDAIGLSDDQVKKVLGGTMARMLRLPSPWS